MISLILRSSSNYASAYIAAIDVLLVVVYGTWRMFGYSSDWFECANLLLLLTLFILTYFHYYNILTGVAVALYRHIFAVAAVVLSPTVVPTSAKRSVVWCTVHVVQPYFTHTRAVTSTDYSSAETALQHRWRIITMLIMLSYLRHSNAGRLQLQRHYFVHQ